MIKSKEMYNFSYSNNDMQVVRLFLLAICVLIDLISIVGIITCFTAKRYIDLVLYAVLILFTSILKIISCFLTYSINIDYNCGELSIIKKYPIKSILLYKNHSSLAKVCKFDGKAGSSLKDSNDLNVNTKDSFRKDHDLKNKKCKRLCSKTCTENLYMIELNGKNYLIRIDDYMIALIEVGCDIS